MTYSLIITCRRKPELLKNVLDNIEETNMSELIVFDIDAIDDSVKKVCEESGMSIRRIATNDMGMANCFDIGIRMAENSTVIYCQDDITPSPHCFDCLAVAYQGNPEYILLSPNIREKQNNLPDEIGIREIDFKENYSGRLFACFAIDKSAYIEFGGLDINFYPVYYEDRDFLYRAKLLEQKVGCVMDIIVEHDACSTVRDHAKHNELLSRNDAYYRAKWGGPPLDEIYTEPRDAKW